MDRIKRYIEIYIPVTTCNLRCSYCYITQHRLFSKRVDPLSYGIDHIREALSIRRLGGICMLNLCGGGETLLPDYMPGLVKALLEEGHYVSVITNGTMTTRIEEMMSTLPAPLKKRLFFKMSFHYLELKKRGLLDVFFNNVDKVRSGGSSFSVEITPCDELIPHIDNIKSLCMERLGALPHITIARDETKQDLPILTSLPREEYARIWDSFNSPLFDFKLKIFGERRRDFCYNGLWGGTLNLTDGIFKLCYHARGGENILDNPDRPIDFHPIGLCRDAHCFNGHLWLTLGMVPSLSTPGYDLMRDRTCTDGGSWLQPEMRSFMQGKLESSNSPLSSFERNKTLLMRSAEDVARHVGRSGLRIYHKLSGK